jgi:hypothetical protein
MSPSYDRNQRLTEADPKPLGQRIPNPLHERIGDLCDVVYRAGHARPAKVKMLAALILAAPTEPATLDQMLRAFDRATVGDALVASESSRWQRHPFPRAQVRPAEWAPSVGSASAVALRDDTAAIAAGSCRGSSARARE